MNYVDGFVAAVPLANKAAYLKHAQEFAQMFKEYGALQVVECWGDDVPQGKLTSFPLAVKLQEGEAVVFSWVQWPSKAARDSAWEKIMNDPREKNSQMPFDGKRLIYGGFQIIMEQ